MAAAIEDIEKLRLQLVDLTAAVESASDGELAELLSGSQRLRNSIDELSRRAVTRAARSGVWKLDGYRSPGRWIALHTGLARGTANRLVRVSRSMSALPYASAAALDGVINDVHVEQLVRCHAASPERFDADTEVAFTELAACGDLDSFAVAVRSWIESAEAVSDDEPPALDAERGSFRLVETFDGWWHGELRLPPADGEIVRQAIERRVGRYLHNQRQGDPSVNPLSMDAIRAQALVDLADQDQRTKPGQRTRPDRYHVALTMSVDEQGNIAPVGPQPGGALCDSALHRLVLGPAGQPLDIGRLERTWPAPLATAIIRRDHHCQFPGCNAPAHHCDIHHCHPWEHGGHTKLMNGLLLCRWHHTFLHAQHWTVELDDNQRPIFRKSDGTRHELVPRAPTRPAPSG